MFSNSFAAVPLSVMSQSRVRAGISPSQRWTRAVLVCIVRPSVLADDGGEHAWLGCVELATIHSLWHDRQTFPSACIYASLDVFHLLDNHRFVNAVSPVITINVITQVRLVLCSHPRSANREGGNSVALPGREHAVASRVGSSLRQSRIPILGPVVFSLTFSEQPVWPHPEHGQWSACPTPGRPQTSMVPPAHPNAADNHPPEKDI